MLVCIKASGFRNVGNQSTGIVSGNPGIKLFWCATLGLDANSGEQENTENSTLIGWELEYLASKWSSSPDSRNSEFAPKLINAHVMDCFQSESLLKFEFPGGVQLTLHCEGSVDTIQVRTEHAACVAVQDVQQ